MLSSVKLSKANKAKQCDPFLVAPSVSLKMGVCWRRYAPLEEVGVNDGRD